MRRLAAVLPLFGSLLLLGGAAIERLSLAPPNDAAPYHQRIRHVAEAIPLNTGDWVGKDAPVSDDAIDMLKPNVLISRSYTAYGRRVWFLLVQCDDVRTLDDHYPPHCYVAMGYHLLSHRPHTWEISGTTVTGIEYEFARVAFDPSTSIVVENFMVLPDKGIVPDMGPVNEAAEDVRRRKYGAAEFEVLFEPGTEADERSRIVEELLKPYMPVVHVILSSTK